MIVVILIMELSTLFVAIITSECTPPLASGDFSSRLGFIQRWCWSSLGRWTWETPSDGSRCYFFPCTPTLVPTNITKAVFTRALQSSSSCRRMCWPVSWFITWNIVDTRKSMWYQHRLISYSKHAIKQTCFVSSLLSAVDNPSCQSTSPAEPPPHSYVWKAAAGTRWTWLCWTSPAYEFENNAGKYLLGLYQRDLYVIQTAVSRGIPVATVIGGGYSQDLDKLALRHSIVHRAATKVNNTAY